MARPTLTLTAIVAQGKGWDALVDANNNAIKDLILAAPMPIGPTVHRVTPSEGSVVWTTFAAADYNGCYAHMVDPNTPATNGHLIFSDGTDWRYQRTHTIVA